MKQNVSLVTLATADLARTLDFYVGGLGWKPAFVNDQVAFFQGNGLIIAFWTKGDFERDMGRSVAMGGRAVSLAHNLGSPAEVDAVVEQARAAGAEVIKQPKTTPWGGYSGYFADPDGHVWEIAHNPSWTISAEGYVTFGP
jgi:catechol 2,3-dioxygenase-like lactoylglutathione lyase family enzyme